MPRIACRRIVLAALALLAGAALRSAGAADQRLAVVNVSLVFEKYDKVPDIQRRTDEQYKTRKNQLQERANELGKRHKALKEFFNQENNTEGVFKAVQELRKDQFYFERDLNALNAEIQREYTKDMREVLKDIRAAVRAIAERGNFSLVLRSPDSDNPDVPETAENSPPRPGAGDNKTYLETTAPTSVLQLVERFNRNPVLFGAKTVDITQDVLKKLNDDFKQRAVPGAGGAPPK